MNALFEDPCTILAHKDLSGSNIASAVSFLSSNRLKTWKPKNLAQKIDGKEYCYIDSDEKNQINDVVFSGAQKCDTTAFGNSSFIERVFEDDQLDNARTFPHNKCVIQIDPKKVTGESSDKFWNKLSELHCSGIEDHIYRENIGIEADLTKNMNEVSRLTKVVAIQEVEIKKRQKQKDDMTVELRKATEKESFLQRASNTLNNKYDDLKKSFSSYQQVFNADRLENTAYIKQVVADIDRFKTDIETFDKRILDLEKDTIKFLRLKEEIEQAYDSRVGDFEKLKVTLLKIQRETADMESSLRECRKQFAKIRVLLESCNTDTIATNKSIKQSEEGYKHCEDVRNICDANLKKVIEQIKDVKVEYKYFYDKYVPCINQQLPSCYSETVKLQQLLQNEKKQHSAWVTLPHYSCDNEKIDKGVSDNKWDRNKQTCENKQRDKEQVYDKYVSLLAVEYQNKLNKIQACSNNKYNVKPMEVSDFVVNIPKKYIPYTNFSDHFEKHERAIVSGVCNLFVTFPWGGYNEVQNIWLHGYTSRFTVSKPLNIKVKGYVNDEVRFSLSLNDKTFMEIFAASDKKNGSLGGQSSEDNPFRFTLDLQPGNVYRVKTEYKDRGGSGGLLITEAIGFDQAAIALPWK
jgi:hypothetical protein